MQTRTEQPTSISGYPATTQHAILTAAVDHENASNQRNIHIIPAKELAYFIALHKRDERYQVIVENEGHYVTLDILQQGDSKSCIVLDAANDARSKPIITALETTAGFTVLKASGLDSDLYTDHPMQTDADNSAMFALDHSIQLAEAPNELHTTLQTKATNGMFTWDVLPPNFLRNTQSAPFLEQYLQKHPNDVDVATKQYIQKGYRDFQTDDKTITQNHAIDIHVFQKAQRVYQKEQILEAMSRAIQESDNSWTLVGKQAKKIELSEIKREFAQEETGEKDPFNSPSVHAFQAAVENQGWLTPPVSTTEYRTRMKALREPQIEHTASAGPTM